MCFKTGIDADVPGSAPRNPDVSPIDHILIGAVGYRLEWHRLLMVFTGDGIPTDQFVVAGT